MNRETIAAPAVSAPRARRTTWLLWLLVLPAYACSVARFNGVTDDAYIAFRYARNLARGVGLTWNAGVDAPVEGFTSPLWVALMAPIEWLGWDPGIASRVISIASGLLVLWLVAYVLVERLSFSTPAALLGLAWTGLMPTFTHWSTGGLETMTFVLLIFGGYERLLVRSDEPRVVGAALAGVAVFACRFDGVGWVIVTLATAWWLGRDRRWPKLRPAVARAAIAIAIGCAVLELVRIAYFGDYLPNTARAKVALDAFQIQRGLYYAGRFVTVVPSAALIAVLALISWRRVLASPPLAGAAALAAATFAHAVLVGGDFMLMFRFFTPAVPFLGILLAQSFESARAGTPARRTIANVFAIVVVIDALLPGFGIEPARHFTRRVFAGDGVTRELLTQARRFDESRAPMRVGIELGKLLAKHTPEDASFVRGAIGAVSYYSDRTVFDAFGLVDRELARMPAEQVPSHAPHIGGHDKYGSLQFFEPRRPTYAGAVLVRREEVERDNPTLVGRMFFSAADKSCMPIYRPVLVPLADYDDGDWFLLLAERAETPTDIASWSGPLLVRENVRTQDTTAR